MARHPEQVQDRARERQGHKPKKATVSDVRNDQSEGQTTRRVQGSRRVVLRAGQAVEVSGPPERETR